MFSIVAGHFSPLRYNIFLIPCSHTPHCTFLSVSNPFCCINKRPWVFVFYYHSHTFWWAYIYSRILWRYYWSILEKLSLKLNMSKVLISEGKKRNTMYNRHWCWVLLVWSVYMSLKHVTVVQRILWHKLESTVENQRLYPSNKLIGRFAAALYRQFNEVLELLNLLA